MPNIKSAKKRVILTEKANLRNRSIRSALRTSIKKADQSFRHGRECYRRHQEH